MKKSQGGKKPFKLHCRTSIQHSSVTVYFCGTCILMASSEKGGLEDSESGRKVLSFSQEPWLLKRAEETAGTAQHQEVNTSPSTH